MFEKCLWRQHWHFCCWNVFDIICVFPAICHMFKLDSHRQAGQRLICAHRFGSSAHTHFVSTCASSAHTDLTHAHTQSIGETQVRTQALSRTFARVVKMEWPLPPLNFTPPVAHQRVSQLGMTTSFSKFYPCLAHKRVSQAEMATSLSKCYPHQRVSQVEMATSFSKFYPCLPTKG